MPAVSPAPAGLRPLWYRSFYWRIAASFIALVVIVLVGQSLMFSYLLTRPQGASRPAIRTPRRRRSPRGSAPRLAADPAALARAAAARGVAGGTPARLRGDEGRPRGREHAGTPLSPSDPRPGEPRSGRCAGAHAGGRCRPTGPVVTAPVQIDGELRGTGGAAAATAARAVQPRSAGCCRCPARSCSSLATARRRRA